MPNIAMLIGTGATASSVSTTLDLFRIASNYEPTDPFCLDLFSVQGGCVPLNEVLSIDTRPLPVRLQGYAAVILPGFFAGELSDLVESIETQWKPMMACVRQLEPTTLVAASCYGTFVLAESGLLDGRAATTTWWMQAAFEQRYPKVRLNAAKALVEDGHLMTAGAMTAHTDLSLQVLRRLKGYAIARRVASVMLVDEAKSSQRPFMALPRNFAEPLVDAAVEWMVQRLGASFAAEELAASMCVSYRTLHRRFRSVTGMAPLAYFQALRIEHAKELLETTQQSVEQIASAAGYADLSSFRRTFLQHTAITPAQYRKKFHRT